jgi:hypothetical protein
MGQEHDQPSLEAVDEALILNLSEEEEEQPSLFSSKEA